MPYKVPVVKLYEYCFNSLNNALIWIQHKYKTHWGINMFFQPHQEPPPRYIVLWIYYHPFNWILAFKLEVDDNVPMSFPFKYVSSTLTIGCMYNKNPWLAPKEGRDIKHIIWIRLNISGCSQVPLTKHVAIGHYLLKNILVQTENKC